MRKYRGNIGYGDDDLLPAILMFARLPARFSTRDFRIYLRLRDDASVGILVRARHVPVLGNPPSRGPWWFATSVVTRFASDPKWLDKATRILREHNRAKNGKAAKRRG